jgi:hypothetical protein
MACSSFRAARRDVLDWLVTVPLERSRRPRCALVACTHVLRSRIELHGLEPPTGVSPTREEGSR